MNKTMILASLMFGLLACRPDAPKASPAQTDAARTFVVEFYNWYHPNDTAIRKMGEALSERPAAFASDLAALIKADRACTAQGQGICNLDFDPFLNSQDPCARYEVGGTATHGGTVGVAIFAVCRGKRDTIPSVIAVVAPVDSGWQFVNFVYPAARTDLRHILGQKTSP